MRFKYSCVVSSPAADAIAHLLHTPDRELKINVRELYSYDPYSLLVIKLIEKKSSSFI